MGAVGGSHLQRALLGEAAGAILPGPSQLTRLSQGSVSDPPYPSLHWSDLGAAVGGAGGPTSFWEGLMRLNHKS